MQEAGSKPGAASRAIEERRKTRMSEKQPAFVVVDRRKFTAEGEIREGYTPPPPVEPAPVAEIAPAPVASAPAEVHARAATAPGNVVTMPARSTVEADDFGSAAELAEEEMAGAGYDVDGGISSEHEAAFLDENLRSEEEEDMEPGPPPTPAETAAQHREYQQSSREMDALLRQANPGMKATAPVGFEHIVQSFYLSAIMAMGAGTEPGQKPRIDILGARQSIDMLVVLADKTRGNLDDKEQRLVDGVTFELRMMFLELTNAISAQAHQPPPVRNPPAPGRK
jgi:hypothetical protein